MKAIYFIAFFGILISSCSKEPRNPVTRSISESGFQKIEAGNQFHFTIAKGNSFLITATGEERDLNDLVFVNDGTELSISYSDHRNNRRIVYFTVSMPSLTGLNISGQSEATVSGFTETEIAKLQVSGQSSCNVSMSSPKFILLASGQSKINFQSGNTSVLEADASGQSEIMTYGLISVDTATVVAAGQSTIKLNVNNSFTADASGQSRIYYKGTPSTKNITQTGQAKVIKE
ncbi:MAG TPA: head GIN domain-containing protein [Chitinophagaceae bacterium]|nr:head GIN domain-containing protein [Chitinophagaceae bacterium]